MSKNIQTKLADEPASCIDDGDLGFHRHLAGKAEERDQFVQMAQMAQAEVAKFDAAVNFWSVYLTEKYGLDAKCGDRVENDGKIVRPQHHEGGDVTSDEHIAHESPELEPENAA